MSSAVLAVWLLSGAACFTPSTVSIRGMSSFVIRNGRSDRRAALSPNCCLNDDELAGPLAGEFWAELCDEAEAEAERLGMEIESISFKQGTLSVLARGAVDELQALNQALSSFLDTAEETALAELPPFMLEVSTPGLSTSLSSDLDFISFKGFEVLVETSEPIKGKTRFNGSLVSRDDDFVTINKKGRLSKLPRSLVALVELPTAKTEPGDPLGAS